MTNTVQHPVSIRTALMDIAAQAASLGERLQEGFIPLPTDPAMIEAQYKAWQTAISKDDSAALERRLGWDKLTPAEVRPLLGNVAFPPGYALPAWGETLAEIIEMGQTTSLDTLLATLPATQPINAAITEVPFFEFWLPFVHIALTRLARMPLSECLNAEMRLKLVRWLVHRLHRLGAETLQGAFWKARLYRRPLLALIGPDGLAKQVEQTGQVPQRAEYLAFIQRLLADPIPFYTEYSVIARIFGTVFGQWADVVEQFLTRLENDLPALCTTFGCENDPGQVIGLEMGISDPHHNGQVALEIEFANGLHLVYKPHSLQAEAAYLNLIHWMNGQTSSHAGLLPLQTYTVLDCGDYGWAEFVHHQPCQDREAVARYYQRMGTTICVLYLLNATDVHHENLIAAGEHPIPVDSEMILYPQVDIDLGIEEDEKLTWQWLNTSIMQSSVFGSGLLPTSDEKALDNYDSSGLGNLNMPMAGGNVPIWKYTNTDDMVLVYEDKTFARGQRTNMPYLGDLPQSPVGYISEITSAFQATYTLLMERRESLETHLIPMFKTVLLRFVMRPTKLYFHVLHSSIAPQYTVNGATFSIHLEHLARAYGDATRRPRDWDVCLEEIRVLENLNIPHFSMQADGKALRLEHKRTVDNVFLVDGYQRMVNNLRAFNIIDCQQQMAYMVAALQPQTALATLAVPDANPSPLLDKGKLVDEAVRLADLLMRSSHRVNDTVNWAYLALEREADTPTKLSGVMLEHIGNGLYTGLAGIAIFFSALWRTTKILDYREWALHTLHIPRTLLQGSGRKLLAQESIGAAGGLGGLIYGLTVCSRLLDNPTLLDEAEDAATLITPDRITADTALDVIGGASGTLLSLLALYQHCTSCAVLDSARLCGDHLLAASRPDPVSGLCAWPTLHGKFLAGFSHGAAGIALSLLRLSVATGEQRYRAAAEEAIAYENTLYSPTHQNWRDLRQDEETYMARWCHGATGIALARLSGLAMLDNVTVQHDIEHGLEATQNIFSTYSQDVDHLCCGNFGRVDILLEAGRRLLRPDLIAQAEQATANVVALAHQAGAYSLLHNQPRGVLNPGLFNGMAGIGYALLRLADPDLPCVLSWD